MIKFVERKFIKTLIRFYLYMQVFCEIMPFESVLTKSTPSPPLYFDPFHFAELSNSLA